MVPFRVQVACNPSRLGLSHAVTRRPGSIVELPLYDHCEYYVTIMIQVKEAADPVEVGEIVKKIAAQLPEPKSRKSRVPQTVRKLCRGAI